MTSKKINKLKKISLKLKPPQKDRLKLKPKKPDTPEEASFKEELAASFDPQNLNISSESEKQSDPDSLPLNGQIQKENSDLPPHSKTESSHKGAKPSDLPPHSKIESLHKEAKPSDLPPHSKTESLHKEAKPKEESYEEKIQALEKSFLYLKADFENYKKRAIKEKTELLRYGGERFILALANEVLDDLDRAYENFNNTQSLESFKSGIDLIYKNLQKILSRFHVESSDPKGQAFDPRCHEALSRQPTEKIPKDHVLTTFRKAYTLHKKLIRPAQVAVATSKEDTSDSS